MKQVLFLLALIIVFQSTVLSQQSSQANKLETKISWKFKTSDKIYSSPIIEDNTLFVGSLDKNFYAIDAKTGKEKWHFQTEQPVMSNALIYKNMVYFESGNILYALDLKGKLKWKFELCTEQVTNRIDDWDFHHSSPIVSNEVIYIGTEKGLVYGIDAKTGKETFKCQTENKEIIRTTPFVYENLLLFGDWDGVFYAWEINKKEQVWQYDTKKDNTYSWRNAIQITPVVYKNNVYFTGRSSCMYCLDAKTGKKKWDFRSPTHQWYVGGLRIKDDVIYVGSSDQHLFHAFDATNGTLIWQTKVGCRVWGTAWVEKDKVYIGSLSMLEINKKTGKADVLVKFEKVNEDRKFGDYVDRIANIHSSPIVDNNTLYFGSDDGCIYAVKLKQIYRNP